MNFLLFISIIFLNSVWLGSGFQSFESILRSYDNSERPVIYGPVVVNVSLVIGSLEVDDERQTLKISGEVQYVWEDIHMRYPSRTGENQVGLQGERWNKLKQHIWLPDITFANTFHSVVPPSEDFLKIEENGRMLWTQRLYVEFPCEMDYSDFPVDNHQCEIKLQSIGYDHEELVPRWSLDESVSYKEAIMSSRFTIEEVEIETMTVVHMFKSKRQLLATVFLESYSGWAVKHTVLPFITAVATAYLSFFVNVRGISSRLIINAVAMIFALSFHWTTYQKAPKVEYTMAIEIFTGACLTFIWVAIAETVVVDLLSHLPTKDTSHHNFNEPAELEDLASTKGYTVALWVDRCFRIIYPAIFIIFNGIFWIVYHTTSYNDF